MSVNPGFGGQQFISNSLKKISELKKIIQSSESPVLIQVDGGVNKGTIQDISLAGADVFVAGSAVFGSENYKETIRTFRSLIDEQV
jgi:ribulose-phosphate 3-epimerase